MRSVMQMKRSITLFMLCCLLVLGSGCNPIPLAFASASASATFGAGWLLGMLTSPTTTETQCFRNGELIDCSEITSGSE